MKKVYLLLLFVFGFSAFAQQKGISYQAVIINPNAVAAPGYNGTSIPLANKAICLSFKIVNSANQVEYQESQAITTDGYGMVNVVIGTGTSGAGLVSTLEAVAWNQGNKKLVVGVNTDGVCSNYSEISNQVLNYTPYSFYAQNADIKDGYVTTAKLADGAVTDPKVAMGINPAKVGLGNVNNTSDANKPVSTATQNALNLKANLASPTFTGTVSGIDKAMVGLSNVDNTTDANKPVSTATQTALNLKANATDVTSSLDLKENVSNKSSDIYSDGSSTTKYPTVKAVKDYVDANASTGTGTIVDADATTKGKIKLAGDLAGTADLPTVPGLALKANTTDVTTSLALKEDVSNKSNATLGTSTTLYPTQNAVKTYVDTAITGATIVDADTATKGKIKLAGDLAGTADLPTVPGLALKAPLASPTFTGTVTAPIYASTPQSLTDAATIAWDPANGLNASVTLGGNRTLSFTTTPTAGSYGTLVVTQDATGGRTLTLPSTANKVLGSTSTTTIALSSAANAKDILNFYYDGTNCYWNIGQGYGTAATSGTTNLVSSVTGTLAVANGGTGATTLTGLVKGNGTGAMTAATAGTDYLAPSGSAASLTNFPTLNQNTTGTAANVTGTVAVANGGTGATSLSANNVLLGNGTNALQVVAPGTSGNVLTSNGTTWSSSAPTASGVPYTGATGSVDLGAYNLTVNGLTVGKGKKDAGTDYQYNSAFGVSALGNFSGGTKNTALGYNALSSVTSSNQNIAIGAYAMGSTTDSFQQSVAVGNQSLQFNKGSFNTALGSGALSGTSLTSAATYLVGVGALALMNNTSGQNNTAVGSYALSTNTTGNNNTALGQGADVSSGNLSNATAIGYNSRVSASNSIQLGNSSVTNVNTYGALTTGFVTYPIVHGTANQVLTTTGSGTLTFTTPVVAKPISDQITASAGQTVFPLTETPITNTTTSPNVRPNVWMFINGIRTNNLAYTISGSSVTYTAANNNNYTIVVGDRIQFDYAY